MIPKVLHCCWFSAKKTALAEKCRESWRVFAPDYEVREWGLGELPALKPPQFVGDALRAGKWAFAADWLRFAALYAEGGVYLDMDVELVAALDVDGEFVAGQWAPGGRVVPEPAAMALEKGSPVAAAMLERYAAESFSAAGTAGESLAAELGRRGLEVRMLPPEAFCPIDVDGTMRRTDKTVGIHRCAMSWCTWRRRLARWLSWHGMRPLVDLALKTGGRR